MSGIYHVTGDVTAPDGTSYGPEYFGGYFSAVAVANAVVEGAGERDETAVVRVVNAEGRRVWWAKVLGSWDRGAARTVAPGSVVIGTSAGDGPAGGGEDGR